MNRTGRRCLLLGIFLFESTLSTARANALEESKLTYEQTEDRSIFIANVRKARQGDSSAQWKVGLTYAKLGDYVRSVPLLRSAAEQGHARAAELLGWNFENGLGTAKNLGEAKRWYLFAAAEGEAGAMAALGRLLLKEEGPNGLEEAWQQFETAARMNNSDAQYFLGWMLTQGMEKSKDDALAYDWFLKAARQGHVGAQLAVAAHLLRGLGVSADEESARKWLARAAATGNPVGNYMLGRLRAGAGKGERELAIRAYRIAASGGHRAAQYELADLLASSDAEADRTEAVIWLGRAIEAGHKAAANRLGELYRDSERVPHQLDKARSLFQQAAEHGDANAMYNLAEMLNNGLGGQRDTEMALKWYVRAADDGNERAYEVVSGLLNNSVNTSALGLKGFWQ
ncbi:MAG: sel1 repeat family protein [Sulfuritalea sp.]|nr:sel1 repeat family protein [Sulfuritalea sp.]